MVMIKTTNMIAATTAPNNRLRVGFLLLLVVIVCTFALLFVVEGGVDAHAQTTTTSQQQPILELLTTTSSSSSSSNNITESTAGSDDDNGGSSDRIVSSGTTKYHKSQVIPIDDSATVSDWILFPAFVELIGCFVMYFLTKHTSPFPYEAVVSIFVVVVVVVVNAWMCVYLPAYYIGFALRVIYFAPVFDAKTKYQGCLPSIVFFCFHVVTDIY